MEQTTLPIVRDDKTELPARLQDRLPAVAATLPVAVALGFGCLKAAFPNAKTERIDKTTTDVLEFAFKELEKDSPDELDPQTVLASFYIAATSCKFWPSLKEILDCYRKLKAEQYESEPIDCYVIDSEGVIRMASSARCERDGTPYFEEPPRVPQKQTGKTPQSIEHRRMPELPEIVDEAQAVKIASQIEQLRTEIHAEPED